MVPKRGGVRKGLQRNEVQQLAEEARMGAEGMRPNDSPYDEPNVGEWVLYWPKQNGFISPTPKKAQVLWKFFSNDEPVCKMSDQGNLYPRLDKWERTDA